MSLANPKVGNRFIRNFLGASEVDLILQVGKKELKVMEIYTWPSGKVIMVVRFLSPEYYRLSGNWKWEEL